MRDLLSVVVRRCRLSHQLVFIPHAVTTYTCASRRPALVSAIDMASRVQLTIVSVTYGVGTHAVGCDGSNGASLENERTLTRDTDRKLDEMLVKRRKSDMMELAAA